MKLAVFMQGICRVYARFPQGLTYLLKIGVFPGRSMTKCKSFKECISGYKNLNDELYSC
jgi:hypothetical protein